MTAESVDRTDLAYWFPKIEAAGLPVPETRIVRYEHGIGLLALLDGQEPEGWAPFLTALLAAGNEVGWPAFLRTGYISGKHRWDDACHVRAPEHLASHVASLVEWSELVDFIGLPTETWAVRQMLDTEPLFHCRAYGNFPVVREFRFFVTGDRIDHVQPYWPPHAAEDGRPDDPNWRELLAIASRLADADRRECERLAVAAGVAMDDGESWSVDLLQDRHGAWYLTDMAEGERSFRWEP